MNFYDEYQGEKRANKSFGVSYFAESPFDCKIKNEECGKRLLLYGAALNKAEPPILFLHSSILPRPNKGRVIFPSAPLRGKDAAYMREG